MWEHYQPAIAKYMFLPYCLYLIIINYISGSLIGNYLESMKLMRLPETRSQDIEDDLNRERSIGFILTILAFIFLICFASLEAKQLRIDGPISYFNDVWNICDCTSICLNLSVIFMFFACLVANEEKVSFTVIHAIAAFACFLMWLKIFYWCRLFSSLAYYVKLIQ